MHPRTNPESASREDTPPPTPATGTPALEAGRRQRPRTVDLERLGSAARLLGDRSRTVRQVLLREFRRAGRAGRPLLSEALRSDDPNRRSHARSIADALDWDVALRRLHRFAAREVIDLEAGLCILSRLDHPDIDLSPCLETLDDMAAEVHARTAHLGDDLQRCRVLTEYLGQELGYHGDMEGYTHPDNVFLHRVIESKQGLPLTLCALYSFVATRCGLRTGLVPLPGHVVLRLYGDKRSLIVDPFHGGEIRSQKSLMSYLAQNGLRFRSVWFRDAPEDRVFNRQVMNLRNALLSLGRTGRARRLTPLIDQLAQRDA